MKKKSSLKILGALILLSIIATSAFMVYNKSKVEALHAFHNEQIAVDTIKLWMKEEEVFKSLQDRPEEEMCVYGYEFNFKNRAINLGFRMDDHTLRRITTHNSKDSLYGIHTGMDVATARDLILAHGFHEDYQKNRYKYGDLFFTIGSKKGITVDFLIIEIIDNDILNYAQ